MSTPSDHSNEPGERQRLFGILRSLHDFDGAQREKSIAELQSLDRKWAFDFLSKLLKDSDSELRCDAAEALVRLDPRLAVPQILPLLHDKEDSVRWYACGLLYDFGDERATQPLVKVLLDDPDSEVRLLAADALGSVGDRSAIPALRQAQQHDAGIDHEGRRVSDAAALAIDSILAQGR